MKAFIRKVGFITLLCGLMACNRGTIQPKFLNHPASEYFPNMVGDFWEYEVYDSSRLPEFPNLPRQYEVKVTIKGTEKLSDGKDAFVWEYSYPDTTKRIFVRTFPDSVRTYGVEALSNPRAILFGEEYILPFANGEIWKENLVDSFSVEQIPILNTPSGIFKNCFNISHYYSGPEIGYEDHYWFVPEVGFVKIYYHESDMGPTLIQVWQLKQYLLK